MSSSGPVTGGGAVSTFLDYAALACIFGCVDAVISGKSWFVILGALAAAILFHVLGIKWPGLREKTGARFIAEIDKIANDRYYQRLAVALVLVCVVSPGLVYVHSLRADLDKYVVPRSLTEKQTADLRQHLSQREPHAVTVKVNPLDAEASQYAGQIFSALKGTDWDVEFSTASAEPNTLNDGLCLGVVGSNTTPQDPKHDAKQLLQEALRAANIQANCGSGSGTGVYKLFILVGHRPLAIGDQEATLSKLGRWIMQLGQ